MRVFETYSKKYDAWYDKHKAAFFSELAAIKKALPKNKNGLEIGVGTGRFAAALGIRTGIDPSPAMLKRAFKRGVGTRWGRGENIPFEDASFDYVTVIITLCFVRNPLKVLKESARVLKSPGRIIVCIIDKESLLGKFYRAKKSVFYKNARFFTVREVTSLLKQAGFRDVSYYQTITDFPEKIRTVEKPKKGFGCGSFVVVSAKK
ncbi:MAG: class I SAM-dependent methyltransferase [Candidatus Omnitrophica bacterium]|jgi:ubiquinone/menaquinone biosynthesis C-methylase UbiE|nr:class I SAM-dependent methyltransferase [Candidatus Omnitrophota bacterium]